MRGLGPTPPRRGGILNPSGDGLGENDRRYLRALRDGRRGQAAPASLLPVGREEVERLIEPFLLQLDAVRITSAGRVLIERGRVLLG